MKKYLLFSALAALTILFVSCPEPLTEDIVTSALDDFPPTIEVLSPDENDTYYAQVNFSLKVSDDSLKEGDGKGDIASIAFEVSNDDFRGGKILISTDDVVTKDDSAGSDIITYDPGSGYLDFSFSTVEPSILDGLVSVSVTVKDRNGNETEEKISLYENDGPWFDYSMIYDDNDDLRNVYKVNENVDIEGTVANSSGDRTSASDIYRIRWNISNILVAELFVDDEAQYEDSYNLGTYKDYYNSVTGLYEVQIAGHLLSANANYFTFDPDTGKIAVTVFMKNQFSSIGTLSFSFEVEDKNGHVINKNELISPYVVLPDIGGIKKDSGSDYYGNFSSNGSSDSIDLLCTGDFSDLTLSYYLKSDENTTSARSIDTTGIGSNYSLDLNNTELADFCTSYGVTGSMNLIVNAVGNSADETTSVALALKEDSTGPKIRNFLMSSNHINTDYANSSSTVTMSFTVNEEESLLSADELTLNYEIGAYNPAALSAGNNDYSYSPSGVAWSNGLTSDEDISVRITLTDRLGNESSFTNGDAEILQSVLHYPDRPVLALVSDAVFNDVEDTKKVIVRVFSNNSTNTAFANSKDSNTVTLEVISGRIIEKPELFIGPDNDTITYSASATGNSFSTGLIAKDITNIGEAEIPFKITKIKDMAGNEFIADIILTSNNSPVTYDSGNPSLVHLVPTFSDSSTGFHDITSDTKEYLNNSVDDNSTAPHNTFLRLTGLNDLDSGYNKMDRNYKNYSLVIDNGGVVLNEKTDLDIPFHLMGISGNNTYTATLTVYDEAGNFSDTVIPFTLDRTAPILSDIGFVSNNSTDIAYAKDEDELTLTYDLVEGDSGVDPDASVIELFDIPRTVTSSTGNDIAVDYSIPNNQSTGNNANIPYAITIYDKAGNSSVGFTHNTAGADNVMYYYGNPVVLATDASVVGTGNVTIKVSSTNGSNTAFANDTNEITVTLVSGRDLVTPTVMFGSDYSVSASSTGLVDKTYTADGDLSTFTSKLSQDNAIGFRVSRFRDKAGNQVASMTDEGETTDSSSVIYDNDDPSLTHLVPTFSDSISGFHDITSDTIEYLNNSIDDNSTAPHNTFLRLAGLNDLDSGHNKMDRFYKNYKLVINNGGSVLLDKTDLDIPFHLMGISDNNTYTATLTVYDEAGNFSDKVIPFTLDRTAPLLSDIGFVSNNGTDIAYAKDEDLLTLSYDLVEGDSGVDPDASVIELFDVPRTVTSSTGNDVSVSYSIPNNQSSGNNANIPYAITIYDKAGNSSDGFTHNSAGADNVMYYYGNPVVLATDASVVGTGNVTIKASSNNSSNTAFANDTNSITVTIVSGRDLAAPTVEFGSDYSASASSTGLVDKTYTATRILSAITSLLSQDNNIGFRVSRFTDKAGNQVASTTADTQTTDSSKVIYDNVPPVLTKFSINLSTAGVVVRDTVTYVNGTENAFVELIALDVDDNPTTLTSLDTHYRGYQYSYSDTFSGLLTNDLNDVSSPYTIPYATFKPTAVEGSANVLKVRVYDQAGNSSLVSGPVNFTLNTVKPKLDNVSGYGNPSVGFTFTFSENLYYVAAASAFTFSGVSTFTGTSGTTGLTLTGSNPDSVIPYELSYSGVTDVAGNSMVQSSYDIYNDINSYHFLGLSLSTMTLQPDIIPDNTQDNSPTSYSTIRTYDYASQSPMSSVQSSMGTELSENLVSTEISELDTLKKAASYSAVPASYRSGAAALEIAAPERILEDLNTSNNLVKDVMDQVALNEAEYKAAIDRLMTPKLSRKRLNNMEAIMEPELFEPEILTVSTTPFLMGAATEVNVVISDSEMEEKASGALLIQILVALAMALLSIGFVVVLKKMSKT